MKQNARMAPATIPALMVTSVQEGRYNPVGRFKLAKPPTSMRFKTMPAMAAAATVH